jgi:hypothetical protein
VTGRAGAVELEVRTSIVQLWNLSNGEAGLAVRVEFRPPGQRRWRRFNLVPDEGQELCRLERHANLAAQMVHAGRVVELVDVDQEAGEDG